MSESRSPSRSHELIASLNDALECIEISGYGAMHGALLRRCREALTVASETRFSKGELQALIDYHDNSESEADAMDMPESAKHHEERRKQYAAMLEKVNADER